MRGEAKEEAVVVGETTTGIREILRRHPENLDSSTIPEPLSQVMYSGKRSNPSEMTNNPPGSLSAAPGVRTAVGGAVSYQAEALERLRLCKQKYPPWASPVTIK
jgi:hypothetical protein